MIFNRKPPEWRNVGAEPPENLKSGGFQAGYKPPAAYFNWFFNRVYECLAELQSTVSGIGQKVDTTGRVLIGDEGTELNAMDTLFVVGTVQSRFIGASYRNMVFERDSDGNIIDGKLVVSEEKPSDATYFAQIENK